jgi:antitoxin component HigA of HigAB toxin-antitoxin module
MDKDPSLSSEDGKLLKILAILVEEYERKKGWEIPMPNTMLSALIIVD